MAQSPKILLVEGQDDRHVVRHLWNRLRQSEPPFDIVDKGNIDKLLKAIEPEIRAPDRVVVGIVADANNSLAARWRAVSDRLREAGIDAPRNPLPGGAIMDVLPRVGVWLMPDNRSTGEIEDFVQRMIPPDDPAWPLAQQYIRDIPEEAKKFQATKTSRAELHAWLATREKPGFMGSAIGRGDLETDRALCTEFAEWIERLFA